MREKVRLPIYGDEESKTPFLMHSRKTRNRDTYYTHTFSFLQNLFIGINVIWGFVFSLQPIE